MNILNDSSNHVQREPTTQANAPGAIHRSVNVNRYLNDRGPGHAPREHTTQADAQEAFHQSVNVNPESDQLNLLPMNLVSLTGLLTGFVALEAVVCLKPKAGSRPTQPPADEPNNHINFGPFVKG